MPPDMRADEEPELLEDVQEPDEAHQAQEPHLKHFGGHSV